MKATRYYFDQRSCDDATALCSQFTGRRLQSPTRSTVPLLDLVLNSGPKWSWLLQKLGAADGCAVHFEFGDPSPKAGGNASQTDALFASDSTVWAVEAKWTEGRDRQTITKRISKPESDGGDPRLTVKGWLRHLQPFAAHPLRLDDFQDIIYQMVHRAASAAYAAARRELVPELVYLHFVPSPDRASAPTDYYISELTRLHERLGRPKGLPFWVIEMPLTYTRAFDAIKHSDKHSRGTRQLVRDALCNGPLFTFGEPSIMLI